MFATQFEVSFVVIITYTAQHLNAPLINLLSYSSRYYANVGKGKWEKYCDKATTSEERKQIISNIFVRMTRGPQYDSELDDETPMTRLLTNIDPNFDAAKARSLVQEDRDISKPSDSTVASPVSPKDSATQSLQPAGTIVNLYYRTPIYSLGLLLLYIGAPIVRKSPKPSKEKTASSESPKESATQSLQPAGIMIVNLY